MKVATAAKPNEASNSFPYRDVQRLYETARALVDGTGSVESLRAHVESLERMARFRESKRGQQVLATAAQLHASDEDGVEVDNNAILYHNDENGYWVSGWLFVPDESLPKSKAKPFVPATDTR